MQVTVHENSPAATIGATAPAPGTVVDSLGRTLKIKELDVLSESRLVRALGADAANNQAYMSGYVLPAVMVRDIDGDPVSLPTTQIAVDGLIQRLGKPGLMAVLQHLTQQATAELNGDDPAKNSQSTPASAQPAG